MLLFVLLSEVAGPLVALPVRGGGGSHWLLTLSVGVNSKVTRTWQRSGECTV